MFDLSEETLATLPERSRVKLERHISDREAARAAFKHASDAEQAARADHGRTVATMRHRQEMPKGFSFGRRSDDDDNTAARLAAPVEAAERALQMAVAARERAAERQASFSFLENVIGWLRRTASPGTVFESAKLDPSVAKTRDLMAALTKIRSDIKELDEEFASVEDAIAPSDDLKKRAFSEIDSIAAKGCPTIYAASRGSSPINLHRQLSVATRHTGSETNPVSIIGDAGASFFTWLTQDIVKEKIGAMIDALPQVGALSDDARENRFRDLASRRLELERVEEALIEMMEADGRIVARRADIDPRAYLGVVA